MSRIPLNPRDAFFGGRTENIVTSCTVESGEEIGYTDICSLYPYVCKRGRFPIGHPRIYIGAECNALTDGQNNNLSRVEGLVKCKVLPPRNLLLPILPVKMYGYDQASGEGGLFAAYVNTFLRLKQQASGWPYGQYYQGTKY